MESEANQVSHTGPGTKKTRDTGVHRKKAAKPSPGSTGQSCRGRGGKSRVTNTFHSAESSPSDTGGSVRVLRARGVVAGRTAESKTVSQKTASGLHLRGKPAGSGSRNPPVRHATAKKSPTKKVSRHVPKRSSSRRNNQRLPTRAKPGIETLLCEEKAPAVRGSDRKKSRRQNALRQKDVKEEDPAKEEEDDYVKNEESADVMVQSEDAEGDNAEAPAPRKRQKQQKVDKDPRLPKRRKKPPVQYVRCEMEGCGTVLAHPRYLQHHIKYQHLLKKTYVCDHPSCGRLFRLQKQLLRHAKHHTDQRDYICEYCARAFKSSHNLVVHRMIHTGEKPIQCEICGFTCRQKASLNWHMKKHDAEASYQFSCSVCGKKFEKKDSVVAHKSKSHPEVLIAEALAANGGSVIRSPISVQNAVPETPSEPTPSCVSEENQEVAGATLTPLQQVVLPLSPQTLLDSSQGPYFQLAAQQVVQVAPEPQAVLHITSPASSHPQLVQLSTLPHSTVSPASPVLPQSSLITLSSVSSLAPQHVTQWESEDNKDLQLPGEGELWNRVVVGNGSQGVGALMWEGNREMKREDEGIVWESERQVLLQSTEVQGDSLISRWATTD